MKDFFDFLIPQMEMKKPNPPDGRGTDVPIERILNAILSILPEQCLEAYFTIHTG